MTPAPHPRRRSAFARSSHAVRAALGCALLLAACGGDGGGSGGRDDEREADDAPTAFPTIWTLSSRRFDAFTGSFIVRESWVVAFEDGTYTRDLDAIHGERIDPPGTGERLGEWRIEDERLLTRFGDDDTFDPQFFATTFRTRPAGADERLDGCFGGTEVPFGFTIVFREVCFTPDGLFRSTRDDLGDLQDAPETVGSYTLDGHRLWLTDDGGDAVPGAFAVLAGDTAAPDSIMLQGERYSRR